MPSCLLLWLFEIKKKKYLRCWIHFFSSTRWQCKLLCCTRLAYPFIYMAREFKTRREMHAEGVIVWISTRGELLGPEWCIWHWHYTELLVVLVGVYNGPPPSYDSSSCWGCWASEVSIYSGRLFLAHSLFPSFSHFEMPHFSIEMRHVRFKPGFRSILCMNSGFASFNLARIVDYYGKLFVTDFG